LFGGVGEAIDRALAKFDVVAAVPAQSCCGLPAWGIGAEHAAQAAAAKFVEAFRGEDYDAILTPCASCAAHLQQTLNLGAPVSSPAIAGRTVFLTGSTGSTRSTGSGEGALVAEAAGLAAKVEDLFSWLARREPAFDLRGLRVAVHLPCHARRDVRDGAAVLRVLAQSGADIIQLPDNLDARCCGMGGSFGARYPDLSRQIAAPKIEAMLAAKPDVIVTNCTGCLLQLHDALDAAGAAIPVRHASELLAP
jgi:Fe-S oxidoreductase